MTRRLLPLLAVAGILLAGCTPMGLGPVTEQTVDEACAHATADIEAIEDDLADALDDAEEDPAAAVEAIDVLVEAMHQSADDLINSEVRTALHDAADALDELAMLLRRVLDDPAAADEDDVVDAATEIADSLADLAELCA